MMNLASWMATRQPWYCNCCHAVSVTEGKSYQWNLQMMDPKPKNKAQQTGKKMQNNKK